MQWWQGTRRGVIEQEGEDSVIVDAAVRRPRHAEWQAQMPQLVASMQGHLFLSMFVSWQSIGTRVSLVVPSSLLFYFQLLFAYLRVDSHAFED